MIVHPDYDSTSLDNDIALLKLKTSIEFDENNQVATVCLPESTDFDPVGAEGTVMGWGTTEYGESFIIKKLKRVQLIVESQLLQLNVIRIKI